MWVLRQNAEMVLRLCQDCQIGGYYREISLCSHGNQNSQGCLLSTSEGYLPAPSVRQLSRISLFFAHFYTHFYAALTVPLKL